MFLLIALPAAIGLADDPVPTTVTISQEPAYVYLYDAVTLTATVSPNPGGGSVQFLYDPYPTPQDADVDPATGTATITIPAVTTDTNGTSRAFAWFRGTPAFASSETSKILDVRFLPNVAIVSAPPPFSPSASAQVTFTPGTGTDCRLDGGAWLACTSPWTTTGLSQGDHALDIRTYAPDGRPGQIATAAWMVDLTPPIPGGITINGGAATTNEWQVQVDYPASDTRSGIAYVVLSQSGKLDPNGDLVGPVDPFAHSTIINWADGPSSTQGIDTVSPSGPRTFWIQWVDRAGNRSAVRSASIDVRVAHVGLAGGAWQTADPTVTVTIDGVDPTEIHGLRLSNAPGDANEIEFASPPATWSLVDPAAGGTASEGLKLLFFRWRDAAGIWSVQGVAPIVYSTAGEPDVLLNDGQAVSAGHWVPVRFVIPSVSTLAGEPGFAYTCDNDHWVAYTLVGSDLVVDLTNADAGCPATEGSRAMRFRWGVFGSYTPPMSTVVTIDAAWSEPRLRTLTFDPSADAVAPVVSPPSAKLSAVTLGTVRLSWSGTDVGSGIALYDVERSSDDGAWVSLGGTPNTSMAVNAATGHTYRFRVRAIDVAGNIGLWAPGSTFVLSGFSEGSAAFSPTSSWKTSIDPRWWGGRVRSATSSAATGSFKFYGKSFAWVGATGPTRGRAQVFVDGRLVATVDLYSPSGHSRQLVFTRTWSSVGTHRVVIRTLATTGRHLVDIDGFVVLR